MGDPGTSFRKLGDLISSAYDFRHAAEPEYQTGIKGVDERTLEFPESSSIQTRGRRYVWLWMRIMGEIANLGSEVCGKGWRVALE